MDKVNILTHVINDLKANRGALNSRVLVGRTISKATIGGDVVNTDVETGVQQNFTTIFDTITGIVPVLYRGSDTCGRRPTRSTPKSAGA